ncbi:MAG: hypothetical protein J6K20_07365 [Thermoguttaceae bacterium]|nr:hypothetical protein [Thermoguttaceae bacterium]MBQ7029650.1 hypothetical protein [Thermoguttaceae bacterium]
MSKFLCIASTTLSAIIFLIFLLDLAAGVPFGKANALMDIIFVLCAGGVGALSVLSLRQQK